MQPPLPIPARLKPIPPSYFVSQRLGVAYLQIPKAGCSSFQALLLSHEKPERYSEIAAQLKISPFVLHHSEDLLERTTQVEGLCRFTFVRHPYARILSFYKNQIVCSNLENEAELAEIAREIGVHGFFPNMPFTDFMDVVLAGGLALKNPHIRPQVDFVFSKTGSNVDYLGKLEELGQHGEFFQKHLQAPLESLPKLNQTCSSASAPSHDLSPYVDKLAEIFSGDFESYGYSKNPRRDH